MRGCKKIYIAINYRWHFLRLYFYLSYIHIASLYIRKVDKIILNCKTKFVYRINSRTNIACKIQVSVFKTSRLFLAIKIKNTHSSCLVSLSYIRNYYTLLLSFSLFHFHLCKFIYIQIYMYIHTLRCNNYNIFCAHV